MNLALILAAFGGGVFGAIIGGTTAFIFTGITALVGIAVMLSGGGDVILNNIAFGPFFGPHVAFVGGVAAAAYAGLKKRKLIKENASEAAIEQYTENDTCTPLYKTSDPIVLLVGGIFGVLGLFLRDFYVSTGFKIDTIALTVVTMAIVCRLLFGSTGLLGVFPKDEKRYDLTFRGILYDIIWSFAFSSVVGYACITLKLNNIGFAISAVSLIFLYFGLNFPVSHHISMVAGYAAIAFSSVFIAGVFGVIACLLGYLVLRTFSTHVDTHIDMPATVIASLSLVILGILS